MLIVTNGQRSPDGIIALIHGSFSKSQPCKAPFWANPIALLNVYVVTTSLYAPSNSHDSIAGNEVASHRNV